VLAIGLTLFFSGALTGTPDEVRAGPLPAPLAAGSAPGVSDRAPTVAPVPRSVSEAPRVAPSAVSTEVQERADVLALAIQRSFGDASLGELPRGRNGVSASPRAEWVGELSPAALASEVAVIEPSSRARPMETPRIAPTRTAERSGLLVSTTLERATTPTRILPPPGLEELAQSAPQAGSLHFESLPPASSTIGTRGAAAGALHQVASAPIPLAPDPIPLAPDPIPLAPDPIPAVRDVRVARTIWHPTAARRFAYVEVSGQVGPLRVREGDSVGRLTVGKIEPWGVIFLDDGVEIRHRVGASP
jgi:hypothetical protein